MTEIDNRAYFCLFLSWRWLIHFRLLNENIRLNLRWNEQLSTWFLKKEKTWNYVIETVLCVNVIIIITIWTRSSWIKIVDIIHIIYQLKTRRWFSNSSENIKRVWFFVGLCESKLIVTKEKTYVSASIWNEMRKTHPKLAFC